MKYNNFAEIQKDLYSEKNISDNVKTSNHNSKFLTINFKKGIETIVIRDIMGDKYNDINYVLDNNNGKGAILTFFKS
jgi:hypothetical protein